MPFYFTAANFKQPFSFLSITVMYRFSVDISALTGINTADLISTLQYLGMLKYWKGSHIILKREVCHVIVSEFKQAPFFTTRDGNRTSIEPFKMTRIDSTDL